jgi:hypothetical protein
MRNYILIGLLVFLSLEIVFSIIVNPLYDYQVNSYTIDKRGYSIKRLYFPDKIDNIEYLFIGSSRMAAAIDINEIIRRTSDTIVVVNAGKGYLTGSVHYWALKKMIANNPKILNNSKVIVEIAGGMNFTEDFTKEKFEIYDGYPHFFLPHMNFHLFIDFLKYSKCKPSTKLQLVGLYCSSLYRTLPFIRDKLKEKLIPIKGSEKLADEGGIKTDLKSIEHARQLMIEYAKEELEQQKYLTPLNEQDLDKSVLAAIHKLIVDNGGQLILLEFPIHSVEMAIYTTELNKKNKKTFYNWTKNRSIPIITVNDFIYSDIDFPDYGHLASDRRVEFTNKVFDKIQNME